MTGLLVRAATPIPPTRAMRSWVTWLCAVLLGALTALLFVLPRGGDELDRLRFPGESAGRMMDRHLEFYAGYDRVPGWERALHRVLFGPKDEVVDQAVGAFRDVLAYFETHPDEATPWARFNTRARLVVTLAETGHEEALGHQLQDLDRTLDEEVMREAVRFAYTHGASGGPLGEIFYGARLLPLGWSSDRLQLRIGDKLERPPMREAAARRLTERGERWRSRLLVLIAVAGGIVIAGLALLPALPRRAPWRAAALETPWRTGQGMGVIVRAALIGLAVSMALAVFANSYFEPGVLALWSTLFASLPMLWLIHRYLLQPRAMGFAEAFGLSLRGLKPLVLARVTLVLVAVDTLGSLAIAWAGWRAGLHPHWSSGLYEQAIFGPWETVFLGTVNVVIWAPIFEEIGFRGLVFGTLRSRYTPTVAIILSALVFSALHLYSVVGFLTVFWSGLVLAYAYERYRSLLPGMLVHAAGNLLAVSPVLLFYR